MAIGQKLGSLKSLKKSLEKGGGGTWIKYVPKNSEMIVRFIEEPENWINYSEHYDETLRKSYPCNNEQGCPGCQTSERKSSRYLANVVLREDGKDKDRVVPFQLPKALANRLVARYERIGTLTDRDYELSRAGDGLDTVYDLDAMEKDNAKISKFTPLDLIKILQDAYDEVFGGDEEEEAPKPKVSTRRAKAAVEDDEDDEDEDDPTEKPAARRPAKRAAAKRGAPDPVFEEDDEDEEDDDVEELPVKPAAKRAAAKKSTPAVEPDEEDEEEEEPVKPKTAAARRAESKAKAAAAAAEEEEDEDEDEDEDEGGPAVLEDDEDDDDEAYTEEDLIAMPLGALRTLARDFGVDPRGMTKVKIVAAILESGEEVDE